MKKNIIRVPAGIRYISDWSKQDSGFTLPDHPCIIDKGLTGCGFTEYCINSEENVILCSPRKMLLENKEQQNQHALYVRNDFDFILDVDKNLNVMDKVAIQDIPEMSKDYHQALKDQIQDYVNQCTIKQVPVKILVTYDSFRIVREQLSGIIDKFRVVVDEFQSIFTDSKFKSGTEIEFLYHLQGIEKLCYVSATPMMDDYLVRLDEFKNLPFYELDWKTEDPLRVIKPCIIPRTLSGISLISASNTVIQSYLNGEYDVRYLRNSNGELEKFESKEAVFFVNSVKNICDIIRKARLRPDQVNILCANTVDNQKKITNSLRVLKQGTYLIGSIPLLGEPRKMFTFCTRTVYLGADFYSDNARSFILSDANIECMAVDITLDLPQIMGRQRLDSNPWKNEAVLFAKTLRKNNIVDRQEFDAFVAKKKKATDSLLEVWDETRVENKNVLSEKFLKDTKASNYKDDYVAVNRHAGSSLVPCFNNLVLIAEERAFDIQQVDYADRFKMHYNIEKDFEVNKGELYVIDEFMEDYKSANTFVERMKLLCEKYYPILSNGDLSIVFKQIPSVFEKYYMILGPEKIKACSYNISFLDKAVDKVLNPWNPEVLDQEIYLTYKEGDRVTCAEVRIVLNDLYEKHGHSSKAEAIDLKNHFELKKVKITQPDKTRANGFKIIKRLR